MQPVHPGKIRTRQLQGAAASANRLSSALRVPSGRITAILTGKRSLTPDTALRLARYFGNSAQFWLNLQTRYDLATTEAKIGADQGRSSRSQINPKCHGRLPKLPLLSSVEDSLRRRGARGGFFTASSPIAT